MSMYEVADHLAAMGRGNDKMLMHVTPREVAGLDTLARSMGGQITTNPQTGLPEAGFFDFLTDYVVPIGLSLWNPYAGAAYSGAKTYADTGDIGAAALSAGLSYGGGQGGDTLMKVGQQAGQEVIEQTAKSALQEGVEQGIKASTGVEKAFTSELAKSIPYLETAGQNLATAGQTGGIKSIGAPGFKGLASQMPDLASQQVSSVGGALGNIGAGAAPAALPPVSSLPMGERLGLAGQGFKESIKSPSKFIEAAGSPGNAAFQATSLALPPLQALGELTAPGMPEEEEYDPRATLNLSRGRPLNLGGGKPLQLFADGGITSIQPDNPGAAVNLSDKGYGMTAFNSAPVQIKPAGYASGGFLNGPGDGMSDSIKATIEGQQEARLADGEFVVPADVVSHLGNGSTKAGAQKLYAMLDRVRKARTGTKKQGKQIKPEKYMPA
jgi:hypothetical protein